MRQAAPFWVTTEVPNSQTLDRACLRLAQDTFRGSGDKCTTASNIFAISRFTLPDVQANRFWPELHRELTSRCGPVLCPDEGALIRFCRGQLEAAFSKELARLRKSGEHHCYIALIFSQAGIGRDRTAIIRDYLKYLCTRNPTQLRKSDGFAKTALDAYMASLSASGREDAKPLRDTLQQIGQEVIDLVSAFLTHNDRVSLFHGGWGDIKETWWRISGRDLDLLTPSAADAIHQFIPLMNNVWSRAAAFREARRGVVDFRWADGTLASTARRHSDLPVGCALITGAVPSANIAVVDHDGLSLDIMKASVPETSHSLEDGYRYRITKYPHEATPDGKPWVPYFPDSGTRPSEWFFWGGVAGPEVIEGIPGRSPVRPGGLKLRASWRFLAGQLVLVLDRIHVPNTSAGMATISIEGQRVWKGRMQSGSPIGVRRLTVHSSRLPIESPLNVMIVHDESGESFERTVDGWAVTDPQILVIGRQVYRSGSKVAITNSGQTVPEILLLTRTPATDISLDGAQNDAPHAAGIGSVLIPIIPEARLIRVASGTSWWTVEIVRTPRYSPPPDAELVKEGVRYTALGALSICGLVADAYLISNLRPETGAIGFWIGTEHYEVFVPVADEHIESAGLNYRVLVGALVSGILDPEWCGFVRITPGTAISRSGNPFTFFVPGTAVITQTSLGERSRITVLDDLEIVAETETQPGAEGSLSVGKLVRDSFSLVVSWQTQVFDVTISGREGLAHGYRHDVMASLPSPVMAKIVASSSNGLAMTIGTAEISVQELGELDITETVTNALRATDEAKVELKSARSISKCWLLTARPVIASLGARATRLGGTSRVSVEGNGKAIRPFRATVTIERPRLPTETCVIDVIPDNEFHWEFVASVPLRGIMGAADIVSLVTELGPIATAAISQEAEPAGELLQTLVKEYRLNSDPRLLEEIMHVLIGEAVAGVSGWRSRIRDARSAIGVESAGSDAERGFDSALNCLTAVQAGRPMPAWPIPQSGGSDVERIAISLWILLAPVHFGIGALDPRRLKHARDAISGESPPTEDDRTGHVVRFAKHHAAVYLRQCGYPQEDEGEQPVPQFAIDLGRLVTNISGTRGRQ